MAGELTRLGSAHVRKVVSIDRECGEGARGKSASSRWGAQRGLSDDQVSALTEVEFEYCLRVELYYWNQVADPGQGLLGWLSYWFQQEIEDLKSGASLEAIAVIERQATELLTMNEKLKADLDEAGLQLDASDKEINDYCSLLTDSQKQIKDMLARGWKMEDNLLKAVRELEALRPELSQKAVEEYKETTSCGHFGLANGQSEDLGNPWRVLI
ncbi:hypothetical protein B296_00011113 [Ensete ventricosum]|uniref:Uncharacterized protein n=1 Tax=Ensete ventricosum TaxID=4639 RepID=A0A427AZ41_ENSVE|nr:hypothetical protein B296_00011113 [Ensete ventricosum]